jgi:hypothetical protein
MIRGITQSMRLAHPITASNFAEMMEKSIPEEYRNLPMRITLLRSTTIETLEIVLIVHHKTEKPLRLLIRDSRLPLVRK